MHRMEKTAPKKMLTAAMVLSLVFMGLTPSHAGPGTFGCRVTALRIGSTELAVANPQYNPCVDSTGTFKTVAPEPVQGYLVSAGVLLASTDVEPRSAKAAASAVDLDVVAPNLFTLSADQTFFGTSTECVNNSQGKPTAQHPKQTATAEAITIQTATGVIDLKEEVVAGQHQDVPIPGVGTAHVFHQSTNDTRPGHKTEEVTIALLFLDVANPSLPDVTLLETKTDFSGQTCAPGTTK